MQGDRQAPESAATSAAPPRLLTATGTKHVKLEPSYLYMATQPKESNTVCQFWNQGGQLAYSIDNTGFLFEKKVLKDGQGNIICTAKKFPLSLAKWTICDAAGKVIATTRSVPGMVKYGVEVLLPRQGSKPVFLATPDLSLQSVNIRQLNGKGQDDTQVCVATYGSNVAVGLISALVQNWSYHIALEPGADAALMCCLLAVYDGLLEWNAAGGLFGMN